MEIPAASIPVVHILKICFLGKLPTTWPKCIMAFNRNPMLAGSDVSRGERRAGDCQDPAWRHDRPARSAPRGGHNQGGERQGGWQRSQSAPGDAEGGQRQRGAENPAQLPGATHSETGQLRADPSLREN